MSNAIYFEVPGHPQPKERARGGRGTFYTPQKTRDYEEKVGEIAALALRDKPMLEGEVSIFIECFVCGKADSDNIMKAIKDALNTIVYRDDTQVAAEAIRRYRCKRIEEHLCCWIAPLESVQEKFAEMKQRFVHLTGE